MPPALSKTSNRLVGPRTKNQHIGRNMQLLMKHRTWFMENLSIFQKAVGFERIKPTFVSPAIPSIATFSEGIAYG